MAAKNEAIGCFVGSNGEWIETYTGKAFPLGAVSPESIDIQDIVHGLSNLCRYSGQCESFYSVAQHSCYVHDVVAKMTEYPQARLAALLHDASEAYLGDMVRPLKRMMPRYRQVEARLQRAIFAKFDIFPSPELLFMIRRADNAVLRCEARQLMRSRGRLWDFGDVDDAGIEIMPLMPRAARFEFTRRLGRYMEV